MEEGTAWRRTSKWGKEEQNSIENNDVINFLNVQICVKACK